MNIKVLSLNLWNGGRLMDRIVNFLRAEQPDLLFLQEAYAGRETSFAPRFRSLPIITSLFPNYDYDFMPAYCDTRKVEGEIEDGQLLLSKWPITWHNHVFFDIPYAKLDQDATTDFSQWPAGLQHVRIQLQGREVDLLNVHGPVNLDGAYDSPRRLKMSQDIIDCTQDRSSVILTGDFNVRPNTQTIGQMEKHFTNVFKDELATTFNMHQKTNPGYANSVVDMLFVSPSIKVLEHSQPQVDISDHLPLVAILDV